VEGGVGVAYSVLYSFFDEADRSPPSPKEYTDVLLRQAKLVEESLKGLDAVVARSPRDLDLVPGKVTLVHCVEGGFHLLGGDEPSDVASAVDVLADVGVAYITLAHLIYRGVATGANAFPFLSEAQYAKRCSQPPIGLTARGRAAVEAMVRRRVLIDVSHMSERSLEDTFELLAKLDPDRRVPVLASHSGYRFGEQHYNLTPETIGQIAARDGVIGLIFAQHQIWDGLENFRFPRFTRLFKSFDDSFARLCDHIDAIHDVTRDYRHIAIGSDLDGFIKPTLKGLRDMRNMRDLAERLHDKYGEANGALICSDNALRPLRSYWQGAAGE
jgi:microsomal dipeptidase-like Zn-dependent dipeptidase